MEIKLLLLIFLPVLFISCTGPLKGVGEYRLLDKTLILIEMDSVKYEDNEKTGEIYIKFVTKKNIDDGTFIGFGGCNNLYGTFEGTYDEVPKINLKMTDKYCDKAGIEKKLVDLLQNLVFMEMTNYTDKSKTNTAYFYSEKPKHKAIFKVME